MEKLESLEDFYKRKFNWLPENFRKEVGHFNIFRPEPSTVVIRQPLDASQRISTLFLELLERQFPIDETHTEVQLRSPSDFAHQRLKNKI